MYVWLLLVFNGKKYIDLPETLIKNAQTHSGIKATAATTVRSFESRTAGWKAVNIWKVIRTAKVFRGFTQS
jgi:hypothetical protein